MRKIRVEIREGPPCMFWLRLTPLSKLPKEIGTAMREIDPKVESVWFPAQPLVTPHRGRCLRCKKKTELFESDLCKTCFIDVSRILQSMGLLMTPSRILLDSLTRWQRFWLRMGKGRVWILGGIQFGITPGKELEFEEALRSMRGKWQEG